MIYSQPFLAAHGLAVTWDNPDIHLERNGVVVDSHSLSPATEYDIVARIWNGSNVAPAIDLPVKFSYLEFGIGTISHPLGQPGDVRCDLPVRGAPGHPAFARRRWRTPETPGHYCVQVELIWADDAEPRNNLGQENVVVKGLNSPNATFEFPVRNDRRFERDLRLVLDSYTLPPPPTCAERDLATAPAMEDDEHATRLRDAVDRHSPHRFPIPEGWSVAASPPRMQLAPGQHTTVKIEITAPDDFVGEQVINVNAVDRLGLVGGVTLKVHN